MSQAGAPPHLGTKRDRSYASQTLGDNLQGVREPGWGDKGNSDPGGKS